MNIYLFGMIGSGKTTLGRIIAQNLGWEFDDLDTAIDRTANKSWRKVIEEDGWLTFRQYEYSICKEWARQNSLVIALGGGTVRYEWNRDVLSSTGYRILLACRLRMIAERVNKCDRPRVNAGTTMEQDIVAIWRNYRHLYYSFADYQYRTDQGKTIQQEADELSLHISKLIALQKEAKRIYSQVIGRAGLPIKD